jgi:hypothetical protein
MYYLKLLLSTIRFIITNPLALLLFLAGVYCLSTGIVLVLHHGF